MVTVLAHALVACAAVRAYRPRGARARFWALAIACSVLPDADVVGFRFGVEYGAPWGHRGMTHSLAFAAFLGALAASLASRGSRGRSWWSSFLFFGALAASHGALDALTDGGLGIAFLAPFDDARSFAPWRPIAVSPIGVANMLSARGADVLLSELVWIGLPCALVWILAGRRRARAPR